MNLRTKFIAIAGSALLLASSLTTGSAAESDIGTASVQINQGTYSVLISDGNFVAKNYSLEEQSTTGNLTIDVSDLRGTATGWAVNISATDFTATNSTSGNTETFDVTNNLSLTPGAVTPGTLPANGKYTGGTVGSSTLIVPETAGGTTGAQIWHAPKNNGAGNYTLAVGGTLKVPGGTVVGTYTSTVTVSLGAAPVLNP